MKKTFVMALAICCGLAGLLMAASVHYRFSLAGNYPGAFETGPLAINSTQIVGTYLTSNSSPSYLQIFRGGAAHTPFLTIAPPESGTSYASGINAHGVVVGGYCIPGCSPYPVSQHGYIWDHGTFTTIDYPGAKSTGAYGINDRGQIVGGFCPHSTVCAGTILNPTAHAFLDDHGTFTKLDYPGSFETQANAINNAGQIVGTYGDFKGAPNSFLYQNGVYTNINYPHAVWTDATAINNHSVVAGSYQSYQNGQLFVHGFLYKNEKFETVDHPNTGDTGLQGLNDDGVIVGGWAPNGGFANFKGIPIR
jgi:probable HAF family extracellular repeat protein